MQLLRCIPLFENFEQRHAAGFLLRNHSNATRLQGSEEEEEEEEEAEASTNSACTQRERNAIFYHRLLGANEKTPPVFRAPVSPKTVYSCSHMAYGPPTSRKSTNSFFWPSTAG